MLNKLSTAIVATMMISAAIASPIESEVSILDKRQEWQSLLLDINSWNDATCEAPGGSCGEPFLLPEDPY